MASFGANDGFYQSNFNDPGLGANQGYGDQQGEGYVIWQNEFYFASVVWIMVYDTFFFLKQVRILQPIS